MLYIKKKNRIKVLIGRKDIFNKLRDNYYNSLLLFIRKFPFPLFTKSTEEPILTKYEFFIFSPKLKYIFHSIPSLYLAFQPLFLVH